MEREWCCAPCRQRIRVTRDHPEPGRADVLTRRGNGAGTGHAGWLVVCAPVNAPKSRRSRTFGAALGPCAGRLNSYRPRAATPAREAMAVFSRNGRAANIAAQCSGSERFTAPLAMSGMPLLWSDCCFWQSVPNPARSFPRCSCHPMCGRQSFLPEFRGRPALPPA